jgi:hypothetical protein
VLGWVDAARVVAQVEARNEARRSHPHAGRLYHERLSWSMARRIWIVQELVRHYGYQQLAPQSLLQYGLELDSLRGVHRHRAKLLCVGEREDDWAQVVSKNKSPQP